MAKKDPLEAAEVVQSLIKKLAQGFGNSLDCCTFSKYIDHLHPETMEELGEILSRKILVNNGLKKKHLDIGLTRASEIAEGVIIEHLNRRDEDGGS